MTTYRSRHLFWPSLVFAATCAASARAATNIPDKPTANDVRTLVGDKSFQDYPALTVAISKSPDWSFRVFAYQYIGEKGKIQAFDSFIGIYSEESHPLVKGVILAQLGHFAGITTRKENWKGVGSPFLPVLPEEEREKVFQLAKEAADPSKPEALRQHAIGVLAEFRRPETAEILAKATTDPSRAVSAIASSAIRFQGGPEAKEFWLKQLKEGTPALKLNAIDALAPLNDPSIDGILKDIANGSDASLIGDANRWIEWRKNRHESQARLERGLHPTPIDRVLSTAVRVALSNGWYFVVVLILPCLIGTFWSFRHQQYDTLTQGAVFIGALLFGLISTYMKIGIQPGNILLVVLAVVFFLCLPLFKRVITLSSTIVFDSTVLLGFTCLAASFALKSMQAFLFAGVIFGVSILLGVCTAGVFLYQRRFSESAHCLAVTSLISLLLGCLPFAFVGM